MASRLARERAGGSAVDATVANPAYANSILCLGVASMCVLSFGSGREARCRVEAEFYRLALGPWVGC
jgi:hypothetical protein